MSFCKKITLCTVLLMSSVSVRPAALVVTAGVMSFGTTLKTALGFMVGTYCFQKVIKHGAYNYYAKGAIKQSKNANIRHDRVKLFKELCLKNGIVVDHVFYNPTMHHRGNAAVLPTFKGNILLIGSGYGLSKHEDVTPLTHEQILFILGHECSHVRHNDIFYRELLTSFTLTGEWITLSCIAWHVSTLDFFYYVFLVTYVGHSVRMALFRHQEYNADYYASDDPKVIQAGIDFWEMDVNKEQYSYVFNTFDPKRDVTTLFDSHGCAASRIKCLEDRLQGLKRGKEQTPVYYDRRPRKGKKSLTYVAAAA